MSADKEEIRDRNDIVDVINSFIPLKQKGRNWLGLCPFHQEKTPSFNVTPQTQSYKCFGCGKSGDVFTFVEEYENMTFVEAAEFLARRVGLVFERLGGMDSREKASEKEQIYEINSAARDYFVKMLGTVKVAQDYLQQRGVSAESIRKFQIGYAPEGWDNLTGMLQSKRFDLRMAASASLLSTGKSGDYYDFFRHRIMFPIHDEQERIVGFGGRAFGDDIPKYLNSGESPVFNKSRLLYGLPFARKKIASEGRSLITEGYMDVVAAHQSGFTNAVATLGTSLTEDHAKKLAQLAPGVTLLYDADNAGIKAALRAAEVFKSAEQNGVREVQLKMVRLPDGEDPDSMLKKGDVAGLLKSIDDAMDYVEYLIQIAKSRQDLTKEEGRAKFISDLYRILADVPQMAVCDTHLMKFANLHPFSKMGIQPAIDQMRKDLQLKRKQLRQARKKKPDVPRTSDSPEKVVAGEAGASTSFPEEPAAKNASNSKSENFKKPLTREERAQLEVKRFRNQVKPVGLDSTSYTAEERAENELIRGLCDPEMREFVLKGILAEEMLTPFGMRFYEFIHKNLTALQHDENCFLRLLNSHEDELFSTSAREKLQEFELVLAKEPMNDTLIVQCIETLRRGNRIRQKEQMAAQLAELMQKQDPDTEDKELIQTLTQSYQRLIRELKGVT